MSNFDMTPTWTVDEAFEAFYQWVVDHPEVSELELEEQIVRYDAEWRRRNN